MGFRLQTGLTLPLQQPGRLLQDNLDSVRYNSFIILSDWLIISQSLAGSSPHHLG